MKKNKIDLYLTNPCFEFWLYLHFEESLKMTQETQNALLEDKKVEVGSEQIRLSLKLLCNLVPNYLKNDIEFEKIFLSRINIAIENSKSYETGLNELDKHLGSNIGSLIERLRIDT